MTYSHLRADCLYIEISSGGFSTDLISLTAENLCSSHTAVHVDDGALLEGYAVSSTTLVVVEVY